MEEVHYSTSTYCDLLLMDFWIDNLVLILDFIKFGILCYWRWWVKLNKAFNIKNNFITANAMSCIELNAHFLIIFIRTLRDHIPNGSDYFLPWLLGSQPCESTFRAARSMTGTFPPL